MNIETQLRQLGIDPASPRVTIGKAVGDIEGKPPKRKSRSDGYKSKWESLYALELAGRRQAGDIEWWAYEPISLVIVAAGGKRCHYTPDFLIVQQGWFTFTEVKGYLRESARIRFLAAKERYPFWRFEMIRRTRSGWEQIL